MTTVADDRNAQNDPQQPDQPASATRDTELTTGQTDAEQGPALDDTPEYPLSAPMKPDDPERRSEQSKAETAGLVEEEVEAVSVIAERQRFSFKLALGSTLLIALSLGFELGRQVSKRR